MPYDSLRDFAPVSLATVSPFVLSVHPSLPVKNVKELIAFAGSRPGR
jgi:tripartite-type tricarboxylate transporter receptor subunit TctC